MLLRNELKCAVTLMTLLASLQSFEARGAGTQIEYSLTNLPKFSDYETNEIFKGKPAKLNFNSFPGSWEFRTRLTEGAAKGPNFAGHYTVVDIGCGTECQTLWIIDAQNGKILARFLTSFGGEFHIDSKLLILNPPTLDLTQAYTKSPQSPIWTGTTDYIEWEKEQGKTVYKVDITQILKNKAY